MLSRLVMRAVLAALVLALVLALGVATPAQGRPASSAGLERFQSPARVIAFVRHQHFIRGARGGMYAAYDFRVGPRQIYFRLLNDATAPGINGTIRKVAARTIVVILEGDNLRGGWTAFRFQLGFVA